MAIAANATTAANKDAAVGKLDFSAYSAERDSARRAYCGGVGLAAAGFAAVAAGFWLKPGPQPQVALVVSPTSAALAVHF